jgi:flagellin-specific chaperone FliS
MMNKSAWSHAIAGYRATSQLALSPGEFALMLHQKLYSTISSAKRADEQNRLDEMVFQLGAASRIISALKLHMDFSAAGLEGRNLRRFYTHIQRDIRRMGMLQKGDRNWSIISDPIQGMVQSIISISKGT